MTCVDCLHYRVCPNSINGIISGCPFSSDRSEWVHLPCNIGKTFFRPISWRNTIDECTVSSLTQKADKTWKIRLTSSIFRSVFEITANDIGKIIFLTRKEAEKALKEQ